jgi:4-hydroxy-3-methylbut-2-enyl diphosphate reductase IspH
MIVSAIASAQCSSSRLIKHNLSAATKSGPRRDGCERGNVRIGLTSGASTPDNLVDTVVRLDELANQV